MLQLTLRSATTALYCVNVPTGVFFSLLASPLRVQLQSLLPPAAQAQLAGMVGLWSGLCGVPIPPPAFYGFLATCKISGALAFLGVLGPRLDRAARHCWLIYMLGAAYTLYGQGESVMPVVPFLAALALRWWCDAKAKEQ
mmetsp:Transcript_26707/g.75456  ORF Transcript_26707/g.75456 Transcript_26707/m.75456 type:complete len:140 (-) Transcript_26707:87-506(-)